MRDRITADFDIESHETSTYLRPTWRVVHRESNTPLVELTARKLALEAAWTAQRGYDLGLAAGGTANANRAE